MQLTYFFYGATVVRLLFPTFFVLLFLLADAKVSLSFFTKCNYSCEVKNYAAQEK